MKFLIINTEAFSPKGLKQKKEVSYSDLPWAVQRFLSAFPKNFVVLDESSKIKINEPMYEFKKSSRTRLIKVLGKHAANRIIMTGTVMSKSPLNLVDQYNFLREDYFPESMWELAERYTVRMTIHAARGRRVLISQKEYKNVREYLKRAYMRGGKLQLEAAKTSIFKKLGIDYAKQEHIITHKKYTPFVRIDELMRRIAADTVFIKRKDVFNVAYENFVHSPIKRHVEISREAKRIANDLVDLGFTDKFILGKAPALELVLRLQDVCNGFEPVEHKELKIVKGENREVRVIEYRPLNENPKIDELMELLDEIGVEENQAAVFSSRTVLLEAIAERLGKEEITHVIFDGGASNEEKARAENSFKSGEARIFLANQASAAYGLNCLSQCSYLVWMCIDGSVEKEYQARHRLLRGQLTAPKIAYAVYVKGSVEERQWEALRVGQELITAENGKEVFKFT
jgi:SNF2 family DNA or RNA helicase